MSIAGVVILQWRIFFTTVCRAFAMIILSARYRVRFILDLLLQKTVTSDHKVYRMWAK